MSRGTVRKACVKVPRMKPILFCGEKKEQDERVLRSGFEQQLTLTSLVCTVLISMAAACLGSRTYTMYVPSILPGHTRKSPTAMLRKDWMACSGLSDGLNLDGLENVSRDIPIPRGRSARTHHGWSASARSNGGISSLLLTANRIGEIEGGDELIEGIGDIEGEGGNQRVPCPAVQSTHRGPAGQPCQLGLCSARCDCQRRPSAGGRWRLHWMHERGTGIETAAMPRVQVSRASQPIYPPSFPAACRVACCCELPAAPPAAAAAAAALARFTTEAGEVMWRLAAMLCERWCMVVRSRSKPDWQRMLMAVRSSRAFFLFWAW